MNPLSLVHHCPPPSNHPATAHGADAVIEMADAQVALWWTHVPPMNGEIPGVIGRFTATDAACAQEVLAAACTVLRTHGCTLAIGPMDGNTWRSYRLVTWRGTAPRFALEPEQPEAWPLWWQDAGFSVAEEYWSACADQLDQADARLIAPRERLQRQGVRIRPLDLSDFTAELERIHTVSEIAFRDNVLYTPLPRAEFLGLYRQVKALVRPELCLIAESVGETGPQPIGFIFTIPDIEQAKRGQPIDTVVVKTLAVLPGRAYAGLGKILLEQCQRTAYGLGFRQAIHALMHAANGSRNLGDGAREIRRYALFAKRLSRHEPG